MQTTTDPASPYILARNEGDPMSWFSARMWLKAAAPGLGAVEVLIEPGAEPPMHVHSREDEWFYVAEGEATFHVGGQSLRAAAGGFVSFPRGIPHTFTVESPRARFLMLNAPGGFERMFELAPQSVPDAIAALRQYGVDVVGPHPREAA